MTTHEDQQLGQKIMKPMKSPMILWKEGMPQYVTHMGDQLDRKVNKDCGKPDALGERGYALVCNDE